MEYEDKFSEFEDMEDDFPKIEKITKKKNHSIGRKLVKLNDGNGMVIVIQFVI